MANGNITAGPSPEEFYELLDAGLTIWPGMTAAAWQYIGPQGIVQGTYESFTAAGRTFFGGSLAGRTILTGGCGGMGGAQPLAGKLAGASILVAEVHSRSASSGARTPATSTTTRPTCRARSSSGSTAAREGVARSVGVVANVVEVMETLLERRITPRHRDRPDHDRSPRRVLPRRSQRARRPRGLRVEDPDELVALARQTLARHVRAMLEFQRRGSVVFEYGNWLRREALRAGVEDAMEIPSFVTLFIRPMFCEAIGPFRWIAISGSEATIATIDALFADMFSDVPRVTQWLEKAKTHRVHGAARPHLLARPPPANRGRAGRQRADRLGKARGTRRLHPRPPRRRQRVDPRARDRGDGRRERRHLGLGAPQRHAERCRRRRPRRPPRARRALAERRRDPRRRRFRRRPRRGSSGCSRPTPGSGSCVTPTRATRRRAPPPIEWPRDRASAGRSAGGGGLDGTGIARTARAVDGRAGTRGGRTSDGAAGPRRRPSGRHGRPPARRRRRRPRGGSVGSEGGASISAGLGSLRSTSSTTTPVSSSRPRSAPPRPRGRSSVPVTGYGRWSFSARPPRASGAAIRGDDGLAPRVPGSPRRGSTPPSTRTLVVADAAANGRGHPTVKMGGLGLAGRLDVVVLSGGGWRRRGEGLSRGRGTGPTQLTANVMRGAAVEAGGLIAACRGPFSVGFCREAAAAGAVSTSITLGRAMLEAEGRGVGRHGRGRARIPRGQGARGGTRAVATRVALVDGFDVGQLVIDATEGALEIAICNEFLCADLAGERVASFPDLIVLLSCSDGMPRPGRPSRDGQSRGRARRGAGPPSARSGCTRSERVPRSGAHDRPRTGPLRARVNNSRVKMVPEPTEERRT